MSAFPTFEVKEKDGRKSLVITCDVTGPGELSSTGKTKIVVRHPWADSGGRNRIKVNLNVMVSAY